MLFPFRVHNIMKSTAKKKNRTKKLKAWNKKKKDPEFKHDFIWLSSTDFSGDGLSISAV